MSAEKSGARRIPRGGVNVPSKASRNELSRPMRRCEACGHWTDPNARTTTRYRDGVITCGRHKRKERQSSEGASK